MNNQEIKHRAQAIIYSSTFCALVYIASLYFLKDRWDLMLVFFPLTIFLLLIPFIVIIANFYLLIVSVLRKNYFIAAISIIFIITAFLPLLIANKKQEEKRLRAEESIQRMNREGKAQEDYINKLRAEGRLE